MVELNKKDNVVEIILVDENGRYDHKTASILRDLGKFIEKESNNIFPIESVSKSIRNGENVTLDHKYVNNLFVNWFEKKQDIYQKGSDVNSGLGDTMQKGQGDGSMYQDLDALNELMNDLRELYS